MFQSVRFEHLSPVVILRFKRLRKNPCHASQHVGGCDDDNQHDERVEREEVVHLVSEELNVLYGSS